LYPSTSSSSQALAQKLNTGVRVGFYVSEGIGHDSIQGFAVYGKETEVIMNGMDVKGAFDTIQVWNYQLAQDYKIVSMVDRLDTGNTDSLFILGKISSIGRVLGDRNVMYKYLNPHVIALLAHKYVHGKSSLKVVLLDSLVGSLLYETLILGAGPVDLATGKGGIELLYVENFVVAVYYNHGVSFVQDVPYYGQDTSDKKKKNPPRVKLGNLEGSDSLGAQVLVLELYESSQVNGKDAR
jgi:hypothetical protein